MSGNVPYFVGRGCYIMLDGKRKVVKDYFFTSSDHPHVPNTDKFWVQLQGEREARAFSDHDFAPLQEPVKGQVPPWLQIGRGIEYREDGQMKRAVISHYSILEGPKEPLHVQLHCRYVQEDGKTLVSRDSGCYQFTCSLNYRKFKPVGSQIQKEFDRQLAAERKEDKHKRAEKQKRLDMITRIWEKRSVKKTPKPPQP